MSRFVAHRLRFVPFEVPWKEGVAACRGRPSRTLLSEDRGGAETCGSGSTFGWRRATQPPFLNVADQFRTEVRELRSAEELAHGDLSSPNVLVNAQNEMHLIDVDAMGLPGLYDKLTDQVIDKGNPHYTHPAHNSDYRVQPHPRSTRTGVGTAP